MRWGLEGRHGIHATLFTCALNLFSPFSTSLRVGSEITSSEGCLLDQHGMEISRSPMKNPGCANVLVVAWGEKRAKACLLVPSISLPLPCSQGEIKSSEGCHLQHEQSTEILQGWNTLTLYVCCKKNASHCFLEAAENHLWCHCFWRCLPDTGCCRRPRKCWEDLYRRQFKLRLSCLAQAAAASFRLRSHACSIRGCWTRSIEAFPMSRTGVGRQIALRMRLPTRVSVCHGLAISGLASMRAKAPQASSHMLWLRCS